MKKILIIIPLVIIAAICGMFFSRNAHSSSAYAETIEEDCKTYTNSKIRDGVNLFDAYINDFNNQKNTDISMGGTKGVSAVYQNQCTFTYDYETISATVLGDDNIVKLIPKALFQTSNEKFYLGDAYGFFIKTRTVFEDLIPSFRISTVTVT